MQRNNLHEVTFENDNVIMREQFFCHISYYCYPEPDYTEKYYSCSSYSVFNSSVLAYFLLFFTLLAWKCAVEKKSLPFRFCFVLNPLLFWKIAKADLFHTIYNGVMFRYILGASCFSWESRRGMYHKWMTTMRRFPGGHPISNSGV